jgi:hypothetical protein
LRRFYHQVERRVDYGARFFRVDVLDQIHLEPLMSAVRKSSVKL